MGANATSELAGSAIPSRCGKSSGIIISELHFRLVLECGDLSVALPQFNVMTVNKPLCLSRRLIIIGAHQPLRTLKMTVRPYNVNAVFWHDATPLIGRERYGAFSSQTKATYRAVMRKLDRKLSGPSVRYQTEVLYLVLAELKPAPDQIGQCRNEWTNADLAKPKTGLLAAPASEESRRPQLAPALGPFLKSADEEILMRWQM